jgi:hypothetical protein
MLLQAKEDMINEEKSKNQQLIKEKDNLIHLIDQKDKFIIHQQALIQDLNENLKSFALQNYK